MARLRKNEPKPGKVMNCVGCGIERYKAPSQIPSSNVFKCSDCRVSLAFSFNCITCGVKVMTQPSQIHLKKRKTCSHTCKWLYIHEKVLPERHKNYSKHQLDRIARYSPETEAWRKAVFARDNYTCKICGIRGSYLEADHIKPWAYFPELRHELSNGRTLCRPCHNTTKIGYKKMRELYGLLSTA